MRSRRALRYWCVLLPASMPAAVSTTWLRNLTSRSHPLLSVGSVYSATSSDKLHNWLWNDCRCLKHVAYHVNYAYSVNCCLFSLLLTNSPFTHVLVILHLVLCAPGDACCFSCFLKKYVGQFWKFDFIKANDAVLISFLISFLVFCLPIKH